VIASTKFGASSWQDAHAEGGAVWGDANDDRALVSQTISARRPVGRRYAKAHEGLSKYIITDMYAKTVQGMAPEESVKRAEGEFRRICSA